jgi:hypothetical protein
MLLPSLLKTLFTFRVRTVPASIKVFLNYLMYERLIGMYLSIWFLSTALFIVSTTIL